MIFRQLTHDDLGCASYLIGDEDAGLAAVVDPRLDIDEYLRLPPPPPPARRARPRRAHGAPPRAPHPRGPRPGARPPGRGAGPPHPHPPRRGPRLRAGAV